MARSKMRQDIIDSFLHALEEGEIPWHRSWSTLTEPPRNAATSSFYRGVNRFWLYIVADYKGFSDPRWCTFKQAKDQGWHVKQGEKGTHVEFWSLYDKKEKKTISEREAQKLRDELPREEYNDRVKPVANSYTVFNGDQIEGIPPLPEAALKMYDLDEEELIRRRTVLTNNMNVKFQEGGGESFYRPSEDCIHLPEIKRFESEYAYLATLLHEAGHATGHESRLNRSIVNAFGTPDYAKEELRAEIASAFTAQTLRLPQGERFLDNHKAYIQNWIAVLKNEPDELFRAIREAEKISDYLMEKGEFDQTRDKEEVKLTGEKQDFVKNHEDMLRASSGKIPLIINAFGGPGSGKTTACMDICQQLKKLGYNAEYVQEYAKELVYDRKLELLDGSEAHQFDMLKEQMHRMDRLYGQTDFIVTDSPILLNTIYNQELTPEYSEMVRQLHSQYQNFSFFMQRNPSSFQQEGRIHSLKESLQKDDEIKRLLEESEIYYGTYTHESIDQVVRNAVNTYRREEWTEKQTDEQEKEPDVEKLVEEVAQMEELQKIPAEKRMTESFGDAFTEAAKAGVTKEDLIQRKAELSPLCLIPIPAEEVKAYGYRINGMTVFPAEISKKLYADGVCLYVLYPDDTEAMVEDISAFDTPDVMFGVESGDFIRYRESWMDGVQLLSRMEEAAHVPDAEKISGTLTRFDPLRVPKEDLFRRMDELRERVPEIREPEVKEPEVKEPEVKEPEVKEPEVPGKPAKSR